MVDSGHEALAAFLALVHGRGVWPNTPHGGSGEDFDAQLRCQGRGQVQ